MLGYGELSSGYLRGVVEIFLVDIAEGNLRPVDIAGGGVYPRWQFLWIENGGGYPRWLENGKHYRNKSNFGRVYVFLRHFRGVFRFLRQFSVFSGTICFSGIYRPFFGDISTLSKAFSGSFRSL